MRKCPFCGQNTDERSRRCMFCGRIMDLALAQKLELEKARREQSARQVRTFAVSFFSIIGIAAITLWAAFFSPVAASTRQSATQTATARQHCDPDAVADSANRLIDLNNRWADVVALAVSVDREAVVVQVDRLQKLRRDARAVQPPPCMTDAYASLLAGMDTHVEALLAYMRGEPVDAVNQAITRGNLEMNTFADEVERIQACAPQCR